MNARIGSILMTACLLVPVNALASWTCTASTVPVSFGIYNPASGTANDAGVGSITVSCWVPDDDDHNIYVYAMINAGPNASGTQRRMKNTSSNVYMNYNLYTSNARSKAWDTTSYYSKADGQPLQLQTVNVHVNYTWNVYGRIPASQAVTSGSYIDTPTVTVWHDISNVAPTPNKTYP